MPDIHFPEGRRVPPSISPELSTHNFGKTIVNSPRPAYSELALRNFSSSEEEYTVTQYWLATRQDIRNIVSAARLAHGDAPGLPHILELGAGTLFLSGLLARTEEAVVTAVEPYSACTDNSPYAHPYLKVVNADAEWAVRNFPESGDREIDLAIWSWPTFGADPLKKMEQIGAKALLMVYSPEHGGYRHTIRFSSDDTVAYRYHLNFDQVPGYHKSALWTGPDHQDINNYLHYLRSLGMNNRQVLYAREGVRLDVSQIDQRSITEQYPWVKELEQLADQRGHKLPGLGGVRPIGESDILCPPEEPSDD